MDIALKVKEYWKTCSENMSINKCNLKYISANEENIGAVLSPVVLPPGSLTHSEDPFI